MKNNKNLARIIAITFVLAGIIAGMGFGCGTGFQTDTFMATLGSKSSSGSLPVITDEAPPAVVSGVRTVSVTNYEAVLDSMLTQTGATPSTNTINRFKAKIGMLSETGAVTTMSSSALTTVTATAGDVCGDLLGTEFAAATPVANVRFIASVATRNPNATASSQLTEPVINDIIRRMARSYWQRNETPEELAVLKAGVAELMTTQPNVSVRNASLYICTAMLSSVSSIEI